MLWAAVLSAVAVVGVDGQPWLAGGLGLMVLALLVASGRWKVLLVGLGFASLAGWLHDRDLASREHALERAGEQARLTLRIEESPVGSGGGWSVLARDVSGGRRVWLRARGAPPMRGALVEASGIYGQPGLPRNPGGFDRRDWLARRGAALEFRSAGPVEVIEPPGWWSRWGEGARKYFREAVTRGLDPISTEAAVIRAVVLGEHPDDDVLIEPFRLTGTLHVFAVSGLHVGMVGLLGWWVLRLAGAPRRVAVLPLVVMMFGYAWLTGMKPPAVRAAWMAALVLGAFFWRRRPDVGNALGFAALLVLLTNGDLLFSAGVQLSFGVVLAIGALHRPVGRLFGWMTRADPLLPRAIYGPWREGWLGFRRRVADLFTVSTSAWLGSAPLTAWHFGLLTPISIPASVVLSVIVFPLLALALLAAMLAPWPAAGSAVNRLNGGLARAMLRMAEVGAEVPGGHLAIPRERPAEAFLVVFDIEEDGSAVWYDEGRSVLIDGGGKRSFEYEVLPCLRRMALSPESVVATHPDGGHVGGLVAAFDAFPVKQGLVPVERALGANYREWLAVGHDRGARMVLGHTGVRYPLCDDAWLEVLGQPDSQDWHRLADDRVMPVRLHWRGWRILFVADQGWIGERSLLAGGGDIGADVIVAGRHVHDGSLGDGFLDATGARAVIATHAEFPSGEQVPERWRRACEARGVAVFHQGESGAVVVTTEDVTLRLRGWLDGREWTLRR